MPEDPIVAFALLTQDDLDRFRGSLTSVWPIDYVPCFEELLEAIDEADRELAREAKGRADRG